MRTMRFAAPAVVAALVAGAVGGASAAVGDDEVVKTVSFRQSVLDAYAQFDASDTGRLVQQQGKMATPNVYLADVARGTEQTGATPAKYWYVRNGVHDDGVSLAPEAVLNANLQNLKDGGKIEDVNFTLVMNLGHTENVSTAEAFDWMDGILADSGPSPSADDPAVTPAPESWWDVTSYSGGTFTESANGSVSASSDTGARTLSVTLDGQPFTVTHYWGYYAAEPNSPAQKINIYVPQNASAASPTFFRTNNSGWTANPFRATVVDGGAYTTGNLTYNTTQGGGNNNPNVIGEVLSRGMMLVSYGARSRADAPVDGQYLGHSPSPMSDTKAAIRFLKYNQVNGALPGDPERVILTGMSGGGGLTAAVAASGNSSDYFADLAEIGALGLSGDDGGYTNDAAVGDDTFATFSSAPIIDLHKANEANEWVYNPTRQKVASGQYAGATGITNGRNNPNYLADWQELGATVLAEGGYQDYIRSLGLEVADVKRILLDMVEVALERALNENNSYRPELVDVASVTTPEQARAALDSLLRYGFNNSTPGFAALPLDWYTVTGGQGAFEVTIDDSAWDAFNEYTYWTAQWMKNPPATDGAGLDTGLGKSGAFATGESTLWGRRDQPYEHVNIVSWAMDPINWPLFGVTASTAPDLATRQAENREIAKTLFVTMPVNTAAPVITGSPDVGQTLTASAGEWGGGESALTYQWVRDGRDIPGATGQQYQVTAADQGRSLSVRVTATNDVGSAQATSESVVVRHRSVVIVTTDPFLLGSSTKPVTVRITVLPRQADGPVTVTIGGKTLTGTVTDGSAVLHAGTLPRGVHKISASYAGSDTVSPSQGTGVFIVLR